LIKDLVQSEETKDRTQSTSLIMDKLGKRAGSSQGGILLEGRLHE
jgi:hypothetical protein